MKNYNYNVTAIVRMAHPKPNDLLKNHIEWFLFCLNEFNERVNDSESNPKNVSVLEIKEDHIRIKISSEQELGLAPGRALTGLSRSLITNTSNNPKYDDYFENNLFHKKLFTYEVYYESNYNDITISELIHGFIDFALQPQSLIPESQKLAYNRIKKIAVESEIVKK